MNELWQKQQESAFKEWQFFYDDRELLEDGELTIKELIEGSQPVDGEDVTISASDKWDFGFIDYEFTINNNGNISYCFYGFADNFMNDLWYFLELLTQTTEDLYFSCEEEGPTSFFYIQNIDGEKIRFMHISSRVQKPKGLIDGMFKVHQDFIVSKYKLIQQFYNALRLPIKNTNIDDLDKSQGIDVYNKLNKDSEIIKKYLKDNSLHSKIIKLANSAGYDNAISTGCWNEYDVYEPIFWEVEPLCVGLPEFILVKDDEVRLTKDSDEAFKVMDEMEQYSSDELENDPIELEPNLTIKSFKFERGGHFGNYQLFEYKANNNSKILTYTEKGECEPSVEPAKVRIDDEKFDEYALGMIKYFHEDLGVAPVCDGEWYEFKATLSNGQKLKSRGHNYFPFTYIKFIIYLEHYWDDSNNIIEYLPMERVENY